MTENEPRIFLCHAKEDKPRVIELYHQLKKAGYHSWLDKYDLLEGLDWWTEIEEILPYFLKAITGELTPEDALDQMAEATDAFLVELGYGE